MEKSFITLGVCAIAILFSVISFFLFKKRMSQISELSDIVLSTTDKEKNLKTLSLYIYVAIGSLSLNILNILLPDGLLKFVIPIITMIIIGILLSNTMEEADAFDLKKDDIDIYLETQEKKKAELKIQKELMEAENRKKREAKEKENS